MHSVTLLSVLALVGASLAAPAPAPYRRFRGHRNKHTGNVVWETVVHTVYVTEIAGAPQPTSTSAPPPPPPPPSTTEVPVVTSAPPPPPPAPTTTEAPPPPPPVTTEEPAPPPPPPATTVAPEPIPTPTPEPAPPADTGYMGIVNEWRGKLGLPAFEQSSAREATALKTAQDGNGEMVHQLLPGTFGQVLAPGKADEFFHCFVGGWLCERPDMAGMNGICATASDGWYYTSTGHADILTSTGYKTIGCANAVGSNGVGIWACDLGNE